MDRKHKGFHTILYGVLQLIHTFNMVMTKIERTIEEIPSTDPRRHALMEALRGSSKLKTDVTKLFKYVTLCPRFPMTSVDVVVFSATSGS